MKYNWTTQKSNYVNNNKLTKKQTYKIKIKLKLDNKHKTKLTHINNKTKRKQQQHNTHTNTNTTTSHLAPSPKRMDSKRDSTLPAL